MNNASELYIGLMSGTSLDSIDAVVTSIDTASTTLISSYQHPIPDALRQQILSISKNQTTTVSEVGTLDHQLGKLYTTAVEKLLAQAQISAEKITAIGNHGQTVFHQPKGESRFTIQLGDANHIASKTGIDTVADFRRLDMALGGQGAPLAPAFHQHLFASRDSTTIVVNIGGIANITVIPSVENTANHITGFDTGPGNILMDGWCEAHSGQQYDHDAHWAKQGEINTLLLNRFLSDPYLATQPPKSTGREHYNQEWIAQHLDSHKPDSIPARDVQRTLCEFTALSITQQVRAYKHGPTCELLVCGGGANNPLLMKRLQQHLPDWQVAPTCERGIPADYMEAMAFAWLARQKIHNQPSSIPSVTGAMYSVPIGVLYPSTREFS